MIVRDRLSVFCLLVSYKTLGNYLRQPCRKTC